MPARSMVQTVVLAYSLLAGPQAWAVTFTDGDFSTGWVDSIIVTDNPNRPGTGPGSSSGSITRIATGGNPDSFRQHDLSIVQGDRIFTVGLNVDAVYDPGASGAIGTLDLNIDLLFDPAGTGFIASQIVLEQAGVVYFSPFILFSQKAWTSHSLVGLTESDFEMTPNTDMSVLPGVHPDFSALGDQITFGYALGAGSSGTHSMPLLNSSPADNWSVQVNPVPEPSTALLLGLGLAGFSVPRPGTRRGWVEPVAPQLIWAECRPPARRSSQPLVSGCRGMSNEISSFQPAIFMGSRMTSAAPTASRESPWFAASTRSIAAWRFSRASSRVALCELAPGISSTKAMDPSETYWKTAVNFMADALPIDEVPS